MKDMNCIFCKIVSGEIPSKTLYEDENFKAILDISPASKGHTIIVSKNHLANLFELSENEAGKVMVFAKKIATALKKVLNCEGLNVLQNNGVAAGQTVFHFHVHLIPRYKDDMVNIKWKSGNVVEVEVNELIKSIQEELK